MDSISPQNKLDSTIFELYYIPNILQKLENNTLIELKIYDNLPMELSEKLCKTLETNSSLQSITYLMEDDEDKFINIQKVLENNSNLKYLHLEFYLWTNEKVFTKNFTNKLRVFKLTCYYLDESEVVIINKFILQNEKLEELSLISNFLKEKINLLAQGIQLSRSLIKLKIKSNNIENLQIIGQALAENNSITDLSLVGNNSPIEGYEFLNKMKRLKRLKLGESFLNTENFKKFAEIFKEMSLELLSLNCEIPPYYLYKILKNLKKNSKLKNLNLKGELILELCVIISEIITENSLKNLEINDLRYLEILNNEINQCNSIEKLTFTRKINKHNGFSNFNIEKNNSLKELIIHNYQQEDGLSNQELFKIMNSLASVSTLTFLSLESTYINDQRALHIAKYLASNQSLKKLVLNNNKIGDEGMKEICSSLTNNFTLKDLDLESNKITSEGIVFLIELYRKNKTLTRILLSDNKISDRGVVLLGEIFENIEEITLDQNKYTSDCLKTIKNRLFYNYDLKKFGLENDGYDDLHFIVFRNLSFIKVPYSFKLFHDIHFSFLKNNHSEKFEENDKKKKKIE